MNMKDKRFRSSTNISIISDRTARERLRVMFLPSQDLPNTSNVIKNV